jgi:aflatoxin B1 aldehyde reductase
VVVYNPLHGGLLTGKYSEDMEAPTEGRFSTEGFLGPIYRAMSLNDNNFRALKMITMVAFKHSIPMVEVAMRWLAHHSKLRMNDKGNDGVIVGISKIGQLKENIGALRSGPLPDDLVEVLENAWLVAKGTSLDPWHIPLAYTYDTEKAVFELSSAEFLAI